jgi:hypothetical protein
VAAVYDALASASSARNEAAAAHAELNKAQTALMRITRELWSAVARDRDLLEAEQAHAAAAATYREISKPILASLSEQSNYRAACDALARAQQHSNEVLARAGAFTDERVAAAGEVLRTKTVVSKLESDALCADPDILKAKERCSAAQQHLKEVRAHIVQLMHQNPTYMAALRAADEAVANAAAADQQLADANEKLSVAQRKFADLTATRDRLNYWSSTHGLPQPE